jgi:predicted DNA-binding protein
MTPRVSVSVRVSAEIKKRLDALEQQTGLDESTIIRAAIEACLDYVEEHGEITLPLAVLPKSKSAAKPTLVSKHPALDPNAPPPPAGAPPSKRRRLRKGERGIEPLEEN